MQTDALARTFACLARLLRAGKCMLEAQFFIPNFTFAKNSVQ